MVSALKAESKDARATPEAAASPTPGNQSNPAIDAALAGLTPFHQADLRKSGLSDTKIAACGFWSVPSKTFTVEFLGWKNPSGTLGSVLGIPFFDANGNRLPYTRGKPDRPRKGKDGKTIKYESPIGVPNLAYFPPGTLAALKDASAPLLITEGEKKAAKADQEGLPCIGLVGVYGWQKRRLRDAKDKPTGLRELIDSLAAIPWAGRTVYIVFDSDAASNPMVRAAERHLAETLTRLGAIVKIVRLPPGEPRGDGKPAKVGLDDYLVASGTDALRELLAQAAAPEPAGSGDEQKRTHQQGRILRRLQRTLEKNAKLWRSPKLLKRLGWLCVKCPAAYAEARHILREAGIKIRDFDHAVKRHVRDALKEEDPEFVRGEKGGFFERDGCICRTKLTSLGPVTVPLANFTATIIGESVYDDGVEQRRMLRISGRLATGRELPAINVPIEEFLGCGWVVKWWGADAIVWPGERNSLPAAIQALSGKKSNQVTYTHLGWREVGGQWSYLHAGGAIGQAGAVAGVDVQPPDALSGYVLPPPPRGTELADDVRASLAVLDVAPDRITVPILAIVYRAVLGTADFSGHLAGPTGAGKTELAALIQQHFGAGLDARHLPGSWASTANSLEGLTFAAKDALLVVDDFAPQGSQNDVARYHREADKLLRAQGNNAGRGRCRVDGSVRTPKPPRGLILSTGEDIPRGQSLRARQLTLELGPHDVHWVRLSICQRDAAAGKFAAALAGFVQWLAPRYQTTRDRLKQEVAALADRVLVEGLHARTPRLVADLFAGLQGFLAFAVETGAIDAAKRAALEDRCWKALLAAGAEQSGHIAAGEPCGHFLRLLAAVLSSGRAHVASGDSRDGEPDNPAAWGWQKNERGLWQSHGRQVGWLDGLDLYLEPEAAYAEVQELGRQQGESLPTSARTLWKRLCERGYLASRDEIRQRYTVRRQLGGSQRREVLHLHSDALYKGEQPSQPAQPSQTPQKHEENGTFSRYGQRDVCAGDSRGDSCTSNDRPPVAAAGASQNGVWDGRDGHTQGDKGSAPAKNSALKRRRGKL